MAAARKKAAAEKAVTASRLRFSVDLSSAPSWGAEKIGQIRAGETCTITSAAADGWVELEMNGLRGFVRREALEE